MSAQGWQRFLAAEGVDDWVVLHGGATAVFRVSTLGEAAMLAGAVAGLPGLDGSGALLTIADDRLTVRLTRGVFRLESGAPGPGAGGLGDWRRHGGVADRGGGERGSVSGCCLAEAVDVVGFWRAVLGYAPSARGASLGVV